MSPLASAPTQEPQARELTADEGRQLIDERARQFLGMSGEKFMRLYEEGALDLNDDDVARVALLIPLGR